MKDAEAEVYQYHARLPSFRRHVEMSQQWIRQALELARRPYVACSFGKDSLCLLHLVALARPGVDVIWLRADEYDEWPDTERVAREFERRFPITLHPVWTMSITECYRAAGGFYVFAETQAQREADRRYARAFVEAMEGEASRLDCDLAFIGLRQEESKRRRLLLRTRGALFFARTHRIMECFPLSRWSARDVWAYIHENELPYPDLYDLHPDRERARNGAMFAANVPVIGGVSTYFGQLAVLRRMYPELFNRFAAEFPDVRAYV